MAEAILRNEQRLLLVDTCGSEATLALAAGDVVVATRMLPGRGASEGLIDAIGDLLRTMGWRLRELAALAVMRGPGSFTGVRVGLSAAKAFAEASGVPLIAVSRLEVLAEQAGVAAGVVVLPAGRKEVFWARAEAGALLEQGVASLDWVAAYAAERGLLIVGEAGEQSNLAGAAGPEGPQLSAAAALPLARRRLAQKVCDDPLLLDALYLHKTEQETLDRQQKHRAIRAESAKA